MKVLRFVSLLVLASGALSAQAAPITYTLTVFASGVYGGTAYTNARVTLTAVGDTSAIAPNQSGNLIVPVTATGSIDGRGSFEFLGPCTFFALATIPTVGLNNVLSGTNTFISTLYLRLPSAPYDLKSPSGPLSAPGHTNPGAPLATTGGDFQIDSLDSDVTFQAIPSPAAVPGPAALGPFALGTLATMRKRRKA